MGRTSAEYGIWFAVTSLGYMSGNFTASRLSQRFGIDAMIMLGIAFELAGASLTAILVATLPDAGPASRSVATNIAVRLAPTSSKPMPDMIMTSMPKRCDSRDAVKLPLI